MNILIALVALAGMFSNTSCRSARDNQIDILESELRAQEDYIYELEDYIVEYSEKLREYRCANMSPTVENKKSVEPELAMPQRATTNTAPRSSSERLRSLREPLRETAPATPQSSPPAEIIESPENLEIPDLEIGEPFGWTDPYQHATPLVDADLAGALLADGSFIPDPAAYQTAAVVQAAGEGEFEEFDEVVQETAQPFEEDITPTRSRDPERLVISHVLRNTEETVEPTSLLSVVEARDASNEPADFNGRVSLMVMTIIDEKPQRVKRWDFTPEETNAAWQSSNLGDGLHLELPMEGVALPAGPLELWVRLETADGRKLLSQLPFEQVTLASIEEAVNHIAASDDDIDGATHLAEANSLRPERPAIKTEPIKQAPAPIATAATESKAEPQWRAATHYSSGPNSGYATTATARQWNSRPADGKAAVKPTELPKTKDIEHQWRARRK